MRKSKNPSKPPKGNAAKYFAYREAWTRIKLATEQGFFLEAIAIEESIISDRLLAYLIAAGALNKPQEAYQCPSLNKIIAKWKEHFPEAIQTSVFEDVHAATDEWRRLRNKALHQIVKLHSEAATNAIDDFLVVAQTAAKNGNALAKAISYWCENRIKTLLRQRLERAIP